MSGTDSGMELFMRVRNYRDQPALNAALYSTKAKLVVLPDHFNAQFKKIPSVAKGAGVWHYYASAQQDPTTSFELLVDDFCCDWRPNWIEKGELAWYGRPILGEVILHWMTGPPRPL